MGDETRPDEHRPDQIVLDCGTVIMVVLCVAIGILTVAVVIAQTVIATR